MQDNVTQGWEIFCDTSYFDMWCIRKEGDKRWGAGVHVVSQDGAEAVRDYIIASTTAQTEAVQKLVEALEKSERTLKQLEQSFSWRAGEDQSDDFDSDGWKAKADECREAAAECSQALAAHRESQP